MGLIIKLFLNYLLYKNRESCVREILCPQRYACPWRSHQQQQNIIMDHSQKKQEIYPPGHQQTTSDKYNVQERGITLAKIMQLQSKSRYS